MAKGDAYEPPDGDASWPEEWYLPPGPLDTDEPPEIPDALQIGYVFEWPDLMIYAKWRSGFRPVECRWDGGVTTVEYH